MSYFNGQELFLSFKTQGQPLILLSLLTEQVLYYSLQGGYVTTYTGAGQIVFKRSSKVFSLITIEFLIHFYVSVFHIALKIPFLLIHHVKDQKQREATNLVS